MLSIEINNKEYKVPGGWEDITLGEFINLDKWVDIKRPEKLTKLIEVSTEEEYEEVQKEIERLREEGEQEKRSVEKEINQLKSAADTAQKHLEAEKIMKKNIGFRFAHALGHGLGIEVHDAPGVFGKKTKWKISENMVFAVEPAIYNKKYGIRIEDDLLVKRNGIEKLTKAPKKLIEL